VVGDKHIVSKMGIFLDSPGRLGFGYGAVLQLISLAIIRYFGSRILLLPRVISVGAYMFGSNSPSGVGTVFVF
jgi:hypothetical protein